MESDDYELPDYDGKDGQLDKPRRGLLIWPWMVLLGLLAIGIGAIGPLVGG